MMQSNNNPDPCNNCCSPHSIIANNNTYSHEDLEGNEDYEGYYAVSNNNNSNINTIQSEQTMGYNNLQQRLIEIQQQRDQQSIWQQQQQQQQEQRGPFHRALQEQCLPFNPHHNTLDELAKLQMQQHRIDEFLTQLRHYPVEPNVVAGFADESTAESHHLKRTSSHLTRRTGIHSTNDFGHPPSIAAAYVSSNQLPQTNAESHFYGTNEILLNRQSKDGTRAGYPQSDFLSKFQKVMEKTEISNGERPLPSNYHPDEFDVACGRGKGSYSRPGNRRFREIVDQFVDEYLASHKKNAKSHVLNKIIAIVTSQNGGKCRFVRQDSKTGAWFEIGIDLARDKVGHAMREAINIRDKKLKKKTVAAKSNKKVDNANADAVTSAIVPSPLELQARERIRSSLIIQRQSLASDMLKQDSSRQQDNQF